MPSRRELIGPFALVVIGDKGAGLMSEIDPAAIREFVRKKYVERTIC